MNSDYLKGKYVIISGGSHGIGLEIAKKLGTLGANITIFSRSKRKLSNASKIFKEKKIKHLTIQADILLKNSCKKIFNLHKKFSKNKIDILINNVGGGGRWGDKVIENTKMNVWEDVYKKNVSSAIELTMMSIKLMKKNKWGRVITISSIHGKEAGGLPWFNMSKAAQISLMKSLSIQKYLVRSGITFNTVAPGAIYIKNTGIEKLKLKNIKKYNKYVNDNYPIGRLGKPEEVADLVTFLTSEKAKFINGSCFTIDGGATRSY